MKGSPLFSLGVLAAIVLIMALLTVADVGVDSAAPTAGAPTTIVSEGVYVPPGFEPPPTTVTTTVTTP